MWFRVSRASCFGEGDMSFDGEVSAANLNVQGILLFWFVEFELRSLFVALTRVGLGRSTSKRAECFWRTEGLFPLQLQPSLESLCTKF